MTELERLRVEVEQLAALHLLGERELDPIELERLCQRCAEALAFARQVTPRAVLAELLQAAPADEEWAALYSPAWRGQAASLRELRLAEERLAAAAAAVLAPPA